MAVWLGTGVAIRLVVDERGARVEETTVPGYKRRVRARGQDAVEVLPAFTDAVLEHGGDEGLREWISSGSRKGELA